MSEQRRNEGGPVDSENRAATQTTTNGEGSQNQTGAQDDTIRPTRSRDDNDRGDDNDQNNETKNEKKNDEDKPPAGPAYLRNPPSVGCLVERLPGILNSANHNEVWGVTLVDGNDVPTVNILIKFLRANEGSVDKAEKHLIKVLQWRRQLDPLHLANALHNHYKFSGLGYLSDRAGTDGQRVIITWILYGEARDVNATFGNFNQFFEWYVALMELAAHELKIDESTTVMDYDGPDPYKMLQVQDFRKLSYLWMYLKIRPFVKWTMDTIPLAYPGLLTERYFVNIPATKGCKFRLPKVFQGRDTTRRFYPISDGATLGPKLSPTLQLGIPQVYGGSGQPLRGNAREAHVPAHSNKAKGNKT